jgi:hypothetical protein
MAQPLVARSRHRSTHPGFSQGIFERLSLPLSDGLANGHLIMLAPQNAKGSLSQFGKRAMQMHPTPITRRVKTNQWAVRISSWGFPNLQALTQKSE